MKRKVNMNKMGLVVFVFCLFVTLVTSLVGNAYEHSMNALESALNKEINILESDIDGLDMQKQELVSFNRIMTVASSKGYTYKQNYTAASVTGVQRD